MQRARLHYFRIYDLRSTYATRLSAGGVADEWVTQLLRQGDAKVFQKYSQMKLQMKREALKKINRRADEGHMAFDTERPNGWGFVTVLPRWGILSQFLHLVASVRRVRKWFRMRRASISGA